MGIQELEEDSRYLKMNRYRLLDLNFMIDQSIMIVFC